MNNTNLHTANNSIDDEKNNIQWCIDELQKNSFSNKYPESLEKVIDKLIETKSELDDIEDLLNTVDGEIDELETNQQNDEEEDGDHEFENTINTGFGVIGWDANNLSDQDIMNALADCFSNPKLNRNNLLTALRTFAGELAGFNS